MARVHLQQLWMILAGWPVTDRIGIADGNRIGGSRPDDGKPSYENGNRMECSSKQGECVPEVQCQQSQQPE